MRSKRLINLEKEYEKNDERYLHRSPKLSVALDNPNWFNVAATECLSVFLRTIPQQSQIAHKVRISRNKAWATAKEVITEP